MARLQPITGKEQVPAKDHAIVDAIAQSRGAIQGPFTMFLHCPEVAGRVAHLGAYVRFEGSLDMRARVLAAMTVAREFEAVYVWGAQTGGARRLGVPEATITAIRCAGYIAVDFDGDACDANTGGEVNIPNPNPAAIVTEEGSQTKTLNVHEVPRSMSQT